MAYQAPYIDENGIHVPEYTDIRDRLIERFKLIFGDDLYLGEDTQDYQMISEFADLMDDICVVISQDYSSHDPNLASGVSLDYLLAINGLRRMVASHSTVSLTLTGVEGTVVHSGSIVMDVNGNQWSIDADATIPNSGTVTAAATAVLLGSIHAEANSVTKIMTPTAGWVSVTNPAAASVGRDVETDSEARERRYASVSNVGIGMIESLIGSLYAIDGVQKVRVYENSTGSTDANGIPAHSICAVVLGGDGQTIANTVFQKKSPGCGTYGTQSKTVTDIYGNNYSVYYSTPVSESILVQITLRTFPGYDSSVADQIKANIQSYIEGLPIGTDLNVGMLWSCILSVNTDMNNPVCSPISVQAKKSGGSYSSDTVSISYSGNPACALSDISITVQS